MTRKKIDLGEYVVVIEYDKFTSHLEVEVLDELGDVIESINISDDDESDDDMGFNLN